MVTVSKTYGTDYNVHNIRLVKDILYTRKKVKKWLKIKKRLRTDRVISSSTPEDSSFAQATGLRGHSKKGSYSGQ